MTNNTVYLITGGNSGLGKGLVSHYLSQPHSTVIAAVHTLDTPRTAQLSDLPVGESSQLIVVEIECKDESAPSKAVQKLTTEHSIDHVDVIVANAGKAEDTSRIATIPLDAIREHADVNAFGALLLFQAFLPLLSQSPNPRFVGITSPAGATGGMAAPGPPDAPFPVSAYGLSKAMLNWIVVKIQHEHRDIVAFVMNPGFVQTDRANELARSYGMEKALTPVEDCIAFMTAEIDGATREKTSGHFRSFPGEDYPF